MSAAEALRLQRVFDGDRAAGLWQDTGLPEMAFEVCAELARRHGPPLGNSYFGQSACRFGLGT
jgi:hypothetical protein